MYQVACYAEGAAVDADIFAEDKDPLVVFHSLAQALADGLGVGKLAGGDRGHSKFGLRSESMFNAISTMETAPTTIFARAEITASACWRRSIAPAISGA